MQPRLSNLVLIAEEVGQARAILARLVDESGADGALLLLRSGEVAVAQVEPDLGKLDTLGALLAGNFAAAREIARMIGEAGFETQFQQGAGRQVITQAVGDGWLLTIVFRPASSLGLVKVLAGRAAEELRPLNEAAHARVARGEVPPGPDQRFKAAASEAIDLLFGEKS
jgi:predicted regulator of Ras-like GTPase activity (Roadblock/LC7/MglB family)